MHPHLPRSYRGTAAANECLDGRTQLSDVQRCSTCLLVVSASHQYKPGIGCPSFTRTSPALSSIFCILANERPAEARGQILPKNFAESAPMLPYNVCLTRLATQAPCDVHGAKHVTTVLILFFPTRYGRESNVRGHKLSQSKEQMQEKNSAMMSTLAEELFPRLAENRKVLLL